MPDDKISPRKKQKLMGHALVQEGVITAKQLRFVLKEQRKVGRDKKEMLGEILVRSGMVDESRMINFLEKFLGIPYVRLRQIENIDIDAVKMIPETMARHFKVLTIGLNKKTNKLIVVMANPFDIVALDTIRMRTGYEIEKCFSQTKDIEEVVDRIYAEQSMQKSVSEFVDIKTAEEEEVEAALPKKTGYELEAEAVKTPVIEFVDSLLKNAVQKRASDIHVEPREDRLGIRFRIDGILREMIPPPKQMESAILTRLKLLGNMDIAEQRLPQDGRFKFDFKGRSIDIRMASSPTIHGEKLVLRILDKASLLINMEDLGMSARNVEDFKTVLEQSYGMVLVTGPTGSGKTTTLYSALNYINKPDKNIVTIEDPVEYQLKGVNQIQTKHHIGLTFSAGLRTVLRQDPDIIMIGEVRDLETLENAVKASLTGHLVLSTIHTNDAPSVVLRLMHMGLESYLISSCLSLVIAQRLVRKICTYCKEKVALSPAMVHVLEKRVNIDLRRVSFYHGKGCDRCLNTGFLGRAGLFEFLMISKRVKQAIIENPSEEELKKIAREEGMLTVFQHGIEKVNEGITTIEEILRVTVLEKSDINRA